MADTCAYEQSRRAAEAQLRRTEQDVATKGLAPTVGEAIAFAQVHATLALAAAIASLGAASTTLNPPPGEHTGDQQ